MSFYSFLYTCSPRSYIFLWLKSISFLWLQVKNYTSGSATVATSSAWCWSRGFLWFSYCSNFLTYLWCWSRGFLWFNCPTSSLTSGAGVGVSSGSATVYFLTYLWCWSRGSATVATSSLTSGAGVGVSSGSTTVATSSPVLE